jgi:hypothetical protein
MLTKRMWIVVLTASAVLLAIGIGLRFAGTALARSESQAGGTIPYTGRLTSQAGAPVTDGVYDFTFALYDAETGGTLLWTETQRGVPVKGGAFDAALGSVNPLSKDVLVEDNHWLAVSVRGPDEAAFTSLAPRQRLSAASTVSPAAGPSCAHTHVDEYWLGSKMDGLKVQTTYTSGNGLVGIANNGALAYGVYGSSANGYGVRGSSGAGIGMYGGSGSGTGVYGQSSTGIGVQAIGWGAGHDYAALTAINNNTTNGIAAYLRANSTTNFPTLEVDQLGGGRVVDLQNNGTGNGQGSGDFIAAFNADAAPQLQFRVGGKGDVWSRDGYYMITQDFAEMLPASGELEPGDVLVIGPDGKLGRSTQPHQPTVAGVYSTQPGILGGQPADGQVDGAIPLAVVGVVPVKVSAENGPIRPGDLLVASATPGHAMKAGPNPPQGTVIGKALEKWDAGAGVVKMLAMLQ